LRRGKLKSTLLLAAFAVVLLAGSISGYFSLADKQPYRLDYHKAVINILVAYREELDSPTLGIGEKYLAEDMAKEMAKYGVEAKVYTLEDSYANLNFNEGFEIYMRAYPELNNGNIHKSFDEDRVAVLFETIPYESGEVYNVDMVFTGSLKKHKEYLKEGIISHFLPQFTRFDKFYPAPRAEYKTKVLYVANQWPDMETRKTIRYALKTGVELDVYGKGWGDVLNGDKQNWWKKKQLPNEELKYYYSSADIVLNDTRDDMIKAGFISNRIFDVTACKGFLISDYIAEIEEIYGDSIPMYKTKEEFKELIDYYLAHPEERREKAERAYQITRERFGAEKVIKDMVQKMEAYRQERGLKSVGE